tara:strand:- start:856 stop:984 length:129 start_codon:yes stop_codon:yes gene_type:complete
LNKLMILIKRKKKPALNAAGWVMGKAISNTKSRNLQDTTEGG